MRIAHLSDPHFTVPTYHPNQFLSKRWLGNLNYILFRKKEYQTEHLWHLPEFLASLNVELVCITGDFSSTSSDEEFALGKKFVDAFKEQGLHVCYLPGNHDCYTRKAQKQNLFYKYLPSIDLEKKRVERLPLKEGWWYIGLDCAIATPPFCAYGKFSPEIEKDLIQALQTIPSTDRVILANHFPLFPTGNQLHRLKRAPILQEILGSYPQVKLYLHGHDHARFILDRTTEGYPLTLDSGSCAHIPNGTFFILDLSPTNCLIQSLRYTPGLTWILDWQQNFSFKNP